MKLSNASGQVVATYTYGTYGELLSGDTTLTRFLYNGRCGVTTDDNGLYYMRQRYYNPEIKRFVNQDILTGSLDNSQSLNRYSYVQGNQVSYTDPFGLSPINGLFFGTGFAHAVLGLLGCIPGPAGAVFDLVDAAIYAFVDHDYGMAALSLLSAVAGSAPIAAGKFMKIGFVAGTKIKTIDGYQNIEDIEDSGLVYAQNEETGETGYKEVVTLFCNEATELTHVQIGDNTIITMFTHPF